MKRRVLSSIIALALCLNLFPVGAFAAEAGTGDGLCPHHPAHTDACGYAPPVSERECTHIHDDSCYTAEINCVHEHTAECYLDSGDASCAHVCTQDSGCITRTLSCPHEHDDTCGYAEGTPGAPCTFVCAICPIEDLIGKLPSRLSADNAEQVQAQIDEIYNLYDALTNEEQRQVDLSPCAALLNQMDGMGSAVLDDGSTSNIEQEFSPDEDTNWERPYEVKRSQVIDTKGYTLTGTKSSAIRVTETGELRLRGGGAIVSKKGAGVEVQSGGKLYIEEPISIEGTTYALYIASGAEVRLSAGTYSGNIAAICVADGSYADLLKEGFAFFDDGNAITPENLANAKTITVGQCTEHTSRTYAHNSGTPTHTWTCTACKTTREEPCTFDFVQDGDGTSTCADCGNSLSIAVNESDLSGLVYDGTVKPEEVGVTVTLNPDSNNPSTLNKNTDFSVNIEKITNAGQAKVTVTGITFTGTFVKTYTVEQDKPGIKWDTSTHSVDYDGSAVTAGELPHITITIKANEDLHPYLRYAHKKTGDADFTDGLPTNAGTYEVKAYLEESQNYETAETEQLLTLTIKPIAPIVTAPEATTPTYNRTAQELVTAGTLHPVALADGLTIEFATAQGGPRFAAIPTATDAGDYTVWYQVTGLTDNYIAPDPNPVEITGVKIQRKAIKPVVTLSQYSYLYDGGYKEPTVTVKDDDRVTDLPDTEYKVEYVDNRNVSTDANPAKVVVTDKIANGGNYDITQVEVEFKITRKTQDTLSITNKPSSFTYGDQFTLSTSGGSGNGLVTWEITNGKDTVATVDANSGQVTITGHGSVTVKATKSGKDPATNVVNYEDATASWTFTAVKKPVTATVTAEDKTYNGDTTATVHAVVEGGVLPGDEITITGLTGTFSDANAGADKTVTVAVDADGKPAGATIGGKNSEHYAVTYSATTVTATIHKAIAKITTAPVAATPTYNGTAQALIGTAAVVDPNSVQVEYALSETGPYSTDFPKGTNAGAYTVWYRVQETDNYTGLAPASVDVTIAKKPVSPTIELSGDGLQTDSSTTPPKYSYIYDGTAKEPVVTLYEADGATLIPAGEYTVAYSNNVNVGTATVTVTAKDGGNYSFTAVTKNFTINKEQAKVLTAPEAAGSPLTFNTFAQKLVTAGAASGGTMVYSTDGENGSYSEDIPTKTDAAEYTVHYKVRGDANHSDSAVGSVAVTIAPKTVKDPTIELYQDDGTTTLVSYTYDGTAKKPKVVVKDGSDTIGANEYNIVYSDNTDAGHGTVNITAKPNGNYTVTGSATFVINKAEIVFNPAPSAATLIYNGTAQELLTPGTTTGGTVLYALNSATSTYSDAIPRGTNAGTYNVYYKVTGDKNHNDLPVQAAISVTIGRKPLTAPTIELTPDSFQYDGKIHLPTVTVKDGDTVLPASEYSWACNVSDPKDGGTYTITISDKTGGNYDLTGANPNTATFTIGKAPQAELVIEGKPEHVCYGDSFQTATGGSGNGLQLTTSGGSGTGAVTWSAEGPATVDEGTGEVKITGVGEVTIKAEKAADTNYEQASVQWTFTAAPKPVKASIVVNNKDYDGTTAATVASASITTINSDTVTITPASITAAFDDPHAGTDKTVTLDISEVRVDGADTAKYAISYPATVTADITQATTTITTAPAAIASLTYSGQPQALITAGQTNVGFLVYSLDGTNFSREIPTGTNAGAYSVYYKVDGTADYTGVAVNAPAISVTIGPKPITPKIELSETSYKYDGTKKAPKVTLKDGDTVIPESQYDVTWAGTKLQTDDDMLRIVDTYTATIKNAANRNYTFNVTAAVEITPAEQAAITITGNPEHVYYGDTITTLGTTGGTGDGTVTWKVTSNGNNASIDSGTGVLTITGTGAVTVRAERSVPNYGTVGDNWNFTVEPKPVTAEVTIAPKEYDGGTTATVASVTIPTINGDTVAVTPTSITATFDDPNAGTGKTVTLDSTHATADNTDKYTVSYPATAKGDITPKELSSVTVTPSDHDLQGNATDGYYYLYDGTEKEPKVTVKYTENGTDKVIPASNYTVEYSNNKNVSTTTEKAAVTVTAKEGGNYKFDAVEVKFTIKSAAAVLVSSPQAKDLTYEKGTKQELVTVGTAAGGTVVYSLSPINPDDEDTYSETIPQAENAGTYTVYYMVKGDSNHESTAPQQMTATIKPREFTPTITLSGDDLTVTNGVYSYTYNGTAKTPTVTVKDGTEAIDATEYTVSYRDNINAGTATVTVSNNNGGNYIVNGSVTFEITKAAPSVTAPTVKTGLQYSGELQDLVSAGVTSHGTVVYSVNGGNYSSAIPTASAVGEYEIKYMVKGDANHSDTAPATLTVKIDKNTVSNPTITLSQDQFTYNGNQQKPTITVYDKNSRVIPEYEYTVDIKGTNGNVGMVNVDTYTVTIAAVANSNYEFQGDTTREFKIVPADQETISITGTPAQVRYGDVIQLGVSGGTGDGTVTWTVAAKDGSTTIATGISSTGLLTVKDVNTPITVTVTRSRANYATVSATWEFTAAKKPVTAVLTGVDRAYIAGDKLATVKAKVEASDLVFGDTFSIPDLTGTFDNENVGTNKTITITGSAPTITDPKAANYEITYPATATASILAAVATVDTEPAANTLTYDASQSQALVTAGTATGGTMVYSLDGKEFTPTIPKGKDAGKYIVYYKAQGDQNHTDSETKTVDVTITQQTVTPQIELSPPSGQYNGTIQQPSVTVRDGANNVIPTSEYKVTYVSDNGENWTDQGTYTVKVENITGGNYIITEAEAEFEISTSAQAPLEIVNKPGLVYYGDTFTLSATGGSGNAAVTWSSSNTSIADIDANGFVTIKGTGSVTITATKAGGGNYDEATATYPLNALQKPVTATVTADDKVYDGDNTATIHITWSGLVGKDTIDTKNLVGTFEDANVGANKTVTITGDPVSDTIAQKYDITVQRTTTASITKATATAPALTASNREYDGTTQALVTGGDANTLYSTSRDGVYSATVPTGTNAGTYTVWYKAQGDDNHSDSEPQAIEVRISPKTLTLAAADIELSGNDLQGNATDGYYYDYDGTERTPTVTLKDGSAVIPAGEYTVTYTDNKNVTTADKKATVTITDKEGGNYTVSGSATFEIRAGAAQLTKSPEAKNLTYTGEKQELVTVGTATGGRIQYKLTSVPTGEPAPSGTFSENIPTGTNAGTYTVDYKVVGDTNHTDGPTGSVTATIQPKTVVTPKITVDGGPFTYTGSAYEPTVTIQDGTTPIPAGEYTLSYQNNTNAGTATVIVTDNNGGNYTVNGTATFEIGKAAATADTAPTGKTGLKYNGTAQELLDTLGTATGGTLVYSLTKDGEYSAAIPTGKDKGSYTVWYKVQGDSNHEDTGAQSVTASIVVNNVTNPTIQVTPASVKYTGEKQTPTVTVKDDNGLLIDGSEYTATYLDENNNSDQIKVGTYTVTITGVANGNYTFDTTDGKNTATFTITPADQTPLTITGTRERVYYGDTIQLGVTGGVSGGTVTWDVGGSTIASIDTNGLLKITGVGSVTVTATSTKTGYTDQTATWALYADKKPVTALVTAKSKTYDGDADATVIATLQASDFVGTDNFTITLTGCTFEDANAGTDKKVKVVSTNPSFTVSTNPGSTDNHENYAITYPDTTTASIFKAAVANVSAPVVKTNLVYTGNPQALVDAGSSTQGTLEYSLDGLTYSASLPTGTDAGNYDVWYRVKGDGNHKDTEGTKLANQVTIAPQEVTVPIIEFTPDSASYDGAVHKPSVTVKDANHRVIPADEYTVAYSDTDWKTASSTTVKHIITIADANEAEGNYKITTKTAEFTISMMGQNPLSIVGQPGEVRYGDSFTLSTTGGSGTGTVTWVSSDTTVATIGQNGLVKVLKSGAATITATKAADGNYGAVSVTWSFSAEKKPVTAIVTAKDKEYDQNANADLVITWKDGDVLSADVSALTTALETVLSGKFSSADAGTDKKVTITGTVPDNDKYAVTYNTMTTASITPKAATLSGSTPTTLTYDGSAQALVTGVTATSGTLVFSTDGSYYTQLVPTGTNAGTYPVWYKAQGNGNYKDSEAVRLNVTIQPKTVNGPVIELSPDSFEYDGTPKKPDVVVKDGSTIIPAAEYTVSYSNNINKGTATVTISDNAGGNYAVSGTANFNITAAKATLTTAPQAKALTYTGTPQELVSRGVVANGTVVYSQTETGSYTTTIPRQTNAGNYEVWYKVQNTDGTDATSPQYLSVTITRKTITAEVLLDPEEFTYSGDPCTPDVFVLDLDSNDLLDPDTDYTVRYMSNTKVGPAKVIVMGKGNYSFSVITTFEIVAAKAKFTPPPTAITGLTYNGTAQALVTAGTAEGGTPYYSLDGVSYFPAIPTAIDRGSYTVYAKVQGDSTHEDSDVVRVPVTIGVNALTTAQLTVSLSATSFPYTGGEQKPTVTVTDNISGNVISADEYTVTYSDNVAVGTATVSIKSRTNGNYSFTASTEFQIVDANQTPLAITGKKDTVYYGDTLSLGTTGGSGDGAVTWSATGPVDTLGDGQYKVTSSGSVTITATKAASGSYGESKDTWTFYALPKPVTATVTAANKVYDGDTNATLTVTLNGLLPGETVDSVSAQGQFADADVGTNKAVTITSLTIPEAVSAKYAITHNNTTTASITPAPAAVTTAPTLVTGSLTYSGSPQDLLASGGTAASGGNLMYSVGGDSYSYQLPTAMDAGSYTVWYKVVATDENHKDSAAVKLGSVTISANQDTPTVLCTPGTLQYDGTEKTPAVVVRDSAQRIIPESEYTVAFDPGTRIAVGKYKVTVTDKPGGNYQFSTVTKEDAFEIVAASQNPLSIVTDIPTDVHYGDTFRLSATGGSGSGAIHWSIKEGNSVATIGSINGNNCVVTVKGIGGFTVEAYREASGGYGQSNTDSVPFVAKPKSVTPVVTVKPKNYDGTASIALDAITATVRPSDLVSDDSITINGLGASYDSANAGTGKTVTLDLTSVAVSGTNADRYVINWPDSVTGTIDRVNAKLDTAPAAVDLTYTGSAQPLVTAHSTPGDIGTVVYSLNDQNGTYSETIPTGTDAGPYTVWYKVADSVNYTGIAPAAIQVEIKKATPSVNTAPTATGTAGQKLSEIKLNGGATDVSGKFAWENPETEAAAGTAHPVIFTPDDTANYNTVTIQVVAVSAGSGGSGGGTGGTSAVDTVSDSTQTTIRNGTANTVLSAADGNQLVKEAVKNQSGTIVIKPEITGDVSKTQVSIPASTVSQIQSETNAALTVASPIADVTIPNGALNTLSRAGGTVDVVTEQVGGAVAVTLTADGKTVEDVPGGVTLTVPAEDAGAGTVAVLVHDDGSREVLQRSVVKDGKLSAPLSGSATVEIVDNGKTFADVRPTDWAAEAVTFASARELFNGTSETTFSPGATTSRGMVATVLYRLEGQPEQALADVYNDVSSDAWYADSVAWAAENGIVNGYGDGQFGPNDSVTREQFVVMLWRYVGSPEANNHDLTAFNDANQINGYALEALCWAVENGVLNGNGNGRLTPGGTATRAEAAQILKNFIENT